MGYMTWFYLSATRDGVDVTEEVLPALIAKTGLNAGHFDGDPETAWCDYHEDMLVISQQFPDVIFRLHGVGEASSDVWVAWYANGQRQGWDLECDIPADPPRPWSELA